LLPRPGPGVTVWTILSPDRFTGMDWRMIAVSATLGWRVSEMPADPMVSTTSYLSNSVLRAVKEART